MPSRLMARFDNNGPEVAYYRTDREHAEVLYLKLRDLGYLTVDEHSDNPGGNILGLMMPLRYFTSQIERFIPSRRTQQEALALLKTEEKLWLEKRPGPPLPSTA